MNIESFNRDLARKVALANSHEKHDELQKAINAWISITEMTLNASKEPNIDSSYRHMLIKKTEQIVEHIKELKVKLAIPRSIQEGKVSQEMMNVQEEENKVIEQQLNKPNAPEVKENPEIKEIPDGFLEIKASKDFKILTPHEELDENILKDAKKVHKLDSNDDKNENIDNDEIIIDQFGEKKMICFACGTENPTNSRKCKSCNTDLV